MRLTTQFLLLAGIVVSAVAYDRKRRAMRPVGAGATTVGTPPHVSRDGTITDAEIVGISEVDPEGLTQMGEAVDLEALEQAHGKKML
jgi:hypothetical protein